MNGPIVAARHIFASAVEWIDDPHAALVQPVGPVDTLFRQHAVVRACRPQRLENEGIGFAIARRSQLRSRKSARAKAEQKLSRRVRDPCRQLMVVHPVRYSRVRRKGKQKIAPHMRFYPALTISIYHDPHILGGATEKSIFLAMLMAQAKILPEVDRRALEIQARAEATQSRRSNRAASATPPRRTASASVAQRPQLRRASGSGNLDLASITTICRAAGGQDDPAQFLSTLARAYSLSAAESADIRTSCGAYLAGRADARARR